MRTGRGAIAFVAQHTFGFIIGYPKGIAKPVRNYAVIAPIEDLVAQGRAIHEEQDGLRLLVDLQKLDKQKAVKALENVLTRLKT
jgi:adenylate cyclase